MRIDCTAVDAVIGDVVVADNGDPYHLEIVRITTFAESPGLLTFWNPEGKAAIFFTDDEITVEREETDEGFECPGCRTRFGTDDEAQACSVAHDEDRAGV